MPIILLRDCYRQISMSRAIFEIFLKDKYIARERWRQYAIFNFQIEISKTTQSHFLNFTYIIHRYCYRQISMSRAIILLRLLETGQHEPSYYSQILLLADQHDQSYYSQILLQTDQHEPSVNVWLAVQLSDLSTANSKKKTG